MRGKHTDSLHLLGDDRITPAGAGKTTFALSTQNVIPDHPRRCGENHALYVSRLPYPGSPPQVRGKLLNTSPGCTPYRITPAGAGKTLPIRVQNTDSPDHPRRCGENFPVAFSRKRPRGSPPQVRGKPMICARMWQNSRITPAGAGKTLYALNNCSTSPDHPRRCGENCHSPIV